MMPVRPNLYWTGRYIKRVVVTVAVKVLYVPAFAHADDGWIVDPETVELGRKELSATLDRLGARYRTSLDIEVLGDSTVEAVRDRAVSDCHDLVMVGPHTTNTLVRLIFGSNRSGVDAGPELAVAVVPRSAWSTARPASTPSRLTVGFHGSDPAVAALAWAVAEANRRGGVICAVMAWCEGDYGGLGGPVSIAADPSYRVGQLARQLAADSLSSCGVPSDRVIAIVRRGMPAPTLRRETPGSDLLVIGAGQSTVLGYRTLGAITLACLARSPLPVVVVPSHAAGISGA